MMAWKMNYVTDEESVDSDEELDEELDKEAENFIQ